MLLKEKFTASGEYDKLMARLVTGGDQKGKKIYEGLCLSSPTASITAVLAVAAIASCDVRLSTVINIGDAFVPQRRHSEHWHKGAHAIEQGGYGPSRPH